MLKELVLGITSLLAQGNNGPFFYEEIIDIPAGVAQIQAPFEWNAVAIRTQNGEELPPIWYEKNGELFLWNSEEEVGGNTDYAVSELFFSGTPVTNLHVKSSKKIKVVAQFYNTHIPDETLTAKFEPLDDDSYDDPRTGLSKPIKKPKYISRTDWGADENLRIWKPGRGLDRGFRSNAPEAAEVSKELQPKIIERRSEKQKLLTWPIEQNQTIRKFIIHHTGEVTNETRNPMDLMRAIYYYHAISRGWGDIGYNYVIDWEGNIYEGRAGGTATVGAHTAYYNVGTVGIALMGNFEFEHPTKRQIQILELLLADQSNRFAVDPTLESYWLGIKSFNVAGHKDVAREGHGTACPGRNLHAILPEIRKEAKALALQLKNTRSKSGSDFLQKSKAAPNIQRRVDFSKFKKSPATLAKLIEKTVLQRGDQSFLEIEVKNNTKTAWKRGEKIEVNNEPEGMLVGDFSATQDIPKNGTGVFRARIMVKTTPNGIYQLELDSVSLSGLENEKEIPTFVYPVQVSGEKSLLTKKFQTSNTIKKNKTEPAAPLASNLKKDISLIAENENIQKVKVKLSYFDAKYVILSSKTPIEIWSKGEKEMLVPENQEIRIIPGDGPQNFKLVTGDENKEISNPQFKTNGVIKIENYDRKLGSVRYNQFRRQINIIKGASRDFYLVNELPIEEYLWGLAEESSAEPDEKRNAIYVLARSYALVYSGQKRKFGTPNYDLEDSPATSQFYLGYDWEMYHSNQKNLVEKTKGEVITFEGKPVIGPYFTQSGGESSSAWVGQYPWAKGKKLPYDEGLTPKGHGIGLSGNSARELAKTGKNYKEILDYFFEGIKVQKVY